MLALFKEWFHIFNSAFFGGGLLELVDHVELWHGGEEGRLVYGRYRRMARGPGSLGINLDERGGLGDNSFEEHRIGTLLHEMIHAFWWIYQCESPFFRSPDSFRMSIWKCSSISRLGILCAMLTPQTYR
jgi:hypothetical protein